MPRGGGKGGTLLRAHSFKLRQDLDELSFIEQLFRTRCIWRLIQKDDPYNRHDQRLLEFQFLRMKGVFLYTHEWPTCGNRQDTKRSAAAKQMHVATGLTVLALKRALLLRIAACELASECKQCVNE